MCLMLIATAGTTTAGGLPPATMSASSSTLRPNFRSHNDVVIEAAAAAYAHFGGAPTMSEQTAPSDGEDTPVSRSTRCDDGVAATREG